MPRPFELPPALRVLTETGWSLASRAPSARVALARAAGFVDPEALPGAIREPVMRELEAARAAACEPLETRVVERALKDAWGRSPGKVLDDFDPEPLAVRAAAQTHRGVAGGAPLAIRVRRPGLERALRSDVALLDTLAAPLRAALPKADTRALLRAVREQALDEADFEHEASTHRRVARVLRDVDGLVVPRAHGELCSEGVFVADLLEGETLADGARPQDPGAAIRALVDAHVAAARAGLALLDARPGHVVVVPGGGIGLLGAGLARPVGRDRVVLGLDAIAALRRDDAEGFARAVAQAGVLPADAARTAHALARSALGPLAAGAATLDAAALRGATVRAADVAPAVFVLVPEAQPHPDDVWLARAAGQLVATLARLGATADWPALVASSAGG
jgi:predicted unusual protein kinase regulating ubiquinone biosynthesis (AarF/ABC1/UbiB family)